MGFLPFIPVLAALPLLLAAVVAALRPGRRPGIVPRLAEAAALLSLLVSVAILGALVVLGTGSTQLEQAAGPIAFRQDPLSATVMVLVGFVGWVVVRFSRTYLDGETREGRFHALILVTLAAVLLLVQSASLLTLLLAIFLVGLGMQQLLLFYADRPAAQRAATKFSLIWFGADCVLLLAAGLLWHAYGTTAFASMASQAVTLFPISAQAGVLLLVLAALLKTAAVPLHGWLTEVMEAPTPVSALLHAGIINAGGFMLIGASDLVQASPGSMAVLVLAGGFTALFGATVMLTQSAVKTALAWSTISQMGFMLLQCGLGLWTLALLHIVAHSLYKAHAFLSSGGAVQAVADVRKPGPVAVPRIAAVAQAFGLALLLYAGVAVTFGLLVGPKSPQALALGAILVFGVAYLVAQGLAGAAPKALMLRTMIASAAAAIGYFSFHILAGILWGKHLPQAPIAGPLEWALIVLSIVSFGMVALAQTLFPLWAHHPATAGLRVHVANGFYLNALLDRWIGGFAMIRHAKANS